MSSDGNGGLMGSDAVLWTSELTRDRAFRCVEFLGRNGIISDYQAMRAVTVIDAKAADENVDLLDIGESHE